MFEKKLENPVRLAELAPLETLKRIGLGNEQVVCDIGAGSGVFTIPAANITTNKVFALDINEEMLSIIAEKASKERLENITCIKVKDNRFSIENDSIDLALLVTVLHEIPNKEDFLAEVKRILNINGKVALIEFHKNETPMGPPLSHRISQEETNGIFQSLGFMQYDAFDLGANFYCQVYKPVS